MSDIILVKPKTKVQEEKQNKINYLKQFVFCADVLGNIFDKIEYKGNDWNNIMRTCKVFNEVGNKVFNKKTFERVVDEQIIATATRSYQVKEWNIESGKIIKKEEDFDNVMVKVTVGHEYTRANIELTMHVDNIVKIETINGMEYIHIMMGGSTFSYSTKRVKTFNQGHYLQIYKFMKRHKYSEYIALQVNRTIMKINKEQNVRSKYMKEDKIEAIKNRNYVDKCY